MTSVEWLGRRLEWSAFLGVFKFRPGNSNSEKIVLYALLGVAVGLIILKSVGLADLSDPAVSNFVELCIEFAKLGAAYQFGAVHKSERAHRRARGG